MGHFGKIAMARKTGRKDLMPDSVADIENPFEVEQELRDEDQQL